MTATFPTSLPIAILFVSIIYLLFTIGGAAGANAATNSSVDYQTEKTNISSGFDEAEKNYQENTTATQRMALGPFNYIFDVGEHWTIFGFEFGYENAEAAEANERISPAVVLGMFAIPVYILVRNVRRHA